MSEFTECYQLQADDVSAGVALLERSGLAGWALPAAGGWVTVLVERDYTTEPDPPLIAANEGLLALFVNAEDHGWSLSLWEGPTLRCTYRCDWDDEIVADTSGVDVDALRRILSTTLDEATLDQLATALTSTPTDDDLDRMLDGDGPPHRVANLLGFPNISWISGDYLSRRDDAHAASAVHVSSSAP